MNFIGKPINTAGSQQIAVAGQKVINLAPGAAVATVRSPGACLIVSIF
jgi:hypothetical protein